MLQHISWQQYLTAITLTTIAWYAYVGIRFYGQHLKKLLNPGSPSLSRTLPDVEMTDVMGEIKPDEQETQDSGELVFAEAVIPDSVSPETLPCGPADELTEEGTALILAYREVNDKSSFLSLLTALLDRYELQRDQISLSSFALAMARQAKNTLPFSLSKSEWAALKWPEH